MTRLQFKKLKENDVILDSDEYYIVIGWYFFYKFAYK